MASYTVAQKIKADAIWLFEEWYHRAPTDNRYMTRFKVVPNAQSVEEIVMLP